MRGEDIQILNYGDCRRDFMYVDDIVEEVLHVMDSAPEKVMGEDGLLVPSYAVHNIGGCLPANVKQIFSW